MQDVAVQVEFRGGVDRRGFGGGDSATQQFDDDGKVVDEGGGVLGEGGSERLGEPGFLQEDEPQPEQHILEFALALSAQTFGGEVEGCEVGTAGKDDVVTLDVTELDGEDIGADGEVGLGEDHGAGVELATGGFESWGDLFEERRGDGLEDEQEVCVAGVGIKVPTGETTEEDDGNEICCARGPQRGHEAVQGFTEWRRDEFRDGGVCGAFGVHG